MDIHFIDVGFGNMTLIIMPEGTVMVYDCNITDDNENSVLAYVETVVGKAAPIDVFINSHRDADHMRGIKLLHDCHPIGVIWDSGVPGTTTDTPEYTAYMALRRAVGYTEIEPRKYWTFGDAKLRCLNSRWGNYTDPNQQSIVIKIEYVSSSAILAGDTDYRPWKEKILPFYSKSSLDSSILLAAHHGSLSFFDDPTDEHHYYTDHIRAIAPDMTIISVGPNVHGLPDSKALQLYDKYSSGSNKGNKVYTTEDKGNIHLRLKDEGGWSLRTNQ